MPETMEILQSELEKPVRNYKKIILYTIAILVFLASSGVMIWSYTIPQSLKNVLFSNDISIITDYVPEIYAEPNVLYPEGGYIKPQGNKIPNRMIEDIRVSLDMSFNGTQEARLYGSYDIVYILSAEGMWVKEYPLAKNKSFKITGSKGSIIREQVTIPLREHLLLIEQVEKDLNVYSTGYTGKLKILVNGSVESGGLTRELNESPEIRFGLPDRSLELLGIINNEGKYVLENVEVEENVYNLFGMSLAVKYIRIFSAALSSVLFLLLLIKLILVIRASYYNNTTEVDRIERKFGHRLIELNASPNFSNCNIAMLNSHKALLKIADENEQHIMVYREPVENSYFVEGNNCIYMHVVKNSL